MLRRPSPIPHPPMHPSHRWWLALLCACGADTTFSSNPSRLAVDAPLHFTAPAFRVAAGVPFRVTLAAGTFDAAPLAALDGVIEQASLRNGGAQQNELVPDVQEGGLGFTLQCAESGDAVLACSVRGRDAAGTAVTHHAKALLQVAAGGQRGIAAVGSRRVGQALELVPLLDPGALEPDATLPVRVRATHAKVGGAELLVAHVPAGTTRGQVTTVRAGDDGTAQVHLTGPGNYLLATSCDHVTAAGDRERLHATLAFTVGGER